MSSQTTQGQSRFNRHPRPTGLLHRRVLPHPTSKPLNPELRYHAQARAQDGQNRLADATTAFAGSSSTGPNRSSC